MARQDGSVLCSEAIARDADVGVEGDPHCAAVCVEGWWSNVTTKPARERFVLWKNLGLSVPGVKFQTEL